jgi:hypothetical protein
MRARGAHDDRGLPVRALLRGYLGRSDFAVLGLVCGDRLRYREQSAITSGTLGERLVDRRR